AHDNEVAGSSSTTVRHTARRTARTARPRLPAEWVGRRSGRCIRPSGAARPTITSEYDRSRAASTRTVDRMTSSEDLARPFAALHRVGEPLLLANAWDVGSAVAVVQSGAAAVATTSAGVAWSLGVPDAADLGADRVAE